MCTTQEDTVALPPKAQIVIGVGDVLCLFNSKEEETKYTITNISVYHTESGNWDIGFFVKEQSEPIPYWMFKELNDNGLMYKDGQGEFYKLLREARAKKLKS